MKPRNVIHRYTSISAVIDLLRRRELTLLDPGAWDDRNDRYFMELYKEYRKLGGLYAACAATCLETYHHWRVFTSAADGACVEIYQAPLERALSSIEGVRFGRVQYLRLEDVERLTKRDAANLPFFKRIAFKPEQEYRIVIETTEPQSPGPRRKP